MKAKKSFFKTPQIGVIFFSTFAQASGERATFTACNVTPRTMGLEMAKTPSFWKMTCGLEEMFDSVIPLDPFLTQKRYAAGQMFPQNQRIENAQTLKVPLNHLQCHWDSCRMMITQLCFLFRLFRFFAETISFFADVLFQMFFHWLQSTLRWIIVCWGKNPIPIITFKFHYQRLVASFLVTWTFAHLNYIILIDSESKI